LPGKEIYSEGWEDRALVLRRQERLHSTLLQKNRLFKLCQKVDYIKSYFSGKRVYKDSNVSLPSHKLEEGSTLLYKDKGKHRNIFCNKDLYDMSESKCIRGNRIANEMKSKKAISKRLLRTMEMFVLPSRTPLNVITNSYDVIHS